MYQLFGEYEVTIDSKGRVKMPSSLLKQLDEEEPVRFYGNKGFDKCLMVYPEKVWDQKKKEVSRLSVYNSDDRQFMRYFYGVKEMVMDSAERILVPKTLIEYAGLQKDIIIFAYMDFVEIWDRETYNKSQNQEPAEFAKLADNVFNKLNEG